MDGKEKNIKGKEEPEEQRVQKIGQEADSACGRLKQDLSTALSQHLHEKQAGYSTQLGAAQ